MPPESIGAAAAWFTRPSAFGPMPAAWVATTFRPDDFYPGFLSNWGKTGVVLSIPTYFGLDLIGYDPVAFQEAGLRLPTPGWTWDDFLRTASQLTKRSGDQVARYGLPTSTGCLPVSACRANSRRTLMRRSATKQWRKC